MILTWASRAGAVQRSCRSSLAVPAGYLAAAASLGTGIPLIREALALLAAILPDPDAIAVIAEIIDIVLDVLVDLPRSVDESILHVLRCLRRRLPKDESILPSESSTLLIAHLPVVQVRLVADEHDHRVRVRVLPRLLEPAGEVVEAVFARHVVDQ